MKRPPRPRIYGSRDLERSGALSASELEWAKHEIDLIKACRSYMMNPIDLPRILFADDKDIVDYEKLANGRLSVRIFDDLYHRRRTLPALRRREPTKETPIETPAEEKTDDPATV